jgi:putative ABC transport system ATP-binding protein
LFPHLDVGENVAFGLESLGVKGHELGRRVARALSLVDLAGFERRRIGQLSGGQQQRVAVARALAGSPSILLADEPTGNLDSNNANSVMELLQQLHRDGSTICMVTHDPRFTRLAERGINLFDGRIVS